MQQWLTILKDYVPLFQTIVWALLVTVGFFLFRRQITALAARVVDRVDDGSSLKFGLFELGPRNLVRVEGADQPQQRSTETKQESVPAWTQQRRAIQAKNQNIFLAHVIDPSGKPGQLFDIFIFLLKQQPNGPAITEPISEVDYAEFYFGRHWGDRVFNVKNEGHAIGIATSAYGPFLCLCRVHFKDKSETVMDRFIDFEMGKALEAKNEITRRV